jgi:hypothetical protein
MYQRPEKNKQQQKKEALIKKETRERMEYLRKTGQLPKSK